jgi:hypothetical protein
VHKDAIERLPQNYFYVLDIKSFILGSFATWNYEKWLGMHLILFN